MEFAESLLDPSQPSAIIPLAPDRWILLIAHASDAASARLVRLEAGELILGRVCDLPFPPSAFVVPPNGRHQPALSHPQPLRFATTNLAGCCYRDLVVVSAIRDCFSLVGEIREGAFIFTLGLNGDELIPLRSLQLPHFIPDPLFSHQRRRFDHLQLAPAGDRVILLYQPEAALNDLVKAEWLIVEPDGAIVWNCGAHLNRVIQGGTMLALGDQHVVLGAANIRSYPETAPREVQILILEYPVQYPPFQIIPPLGIEAHSIALARLPDGRLAVATTPCNAGGQGTLRIGQISASGIEWQATWHFSAAPGPIAICTTAGAAICCVYNTSDATTFAVMHTQRGNGEPFHQQRLRDGAADALYAFQLVASDTAIVLGRREDRLFAARFTLPLAGDLHSVPATARDLRLSHDGHDLALLSYIDNADQERLKFSAVSAEQLNNAITALALPDIDAATVTMLEAGRALVVLRQRSLPHAVLARRSHENVWTFDEPVMLTPFAARDLAVLALRPNLALVVWLASDERGSRSTSYMQLRIGAERIEAASMPLPLFTDDGKGAGTQREPRMLALPKDRFLLAYQNASGACLRIGRLTEEGSLVWGTVCRYADGATDVSLALLSPTRAALAYRDYIRDGDWATVVMVDLQRDEPAIGRAEIIHKAPTAAISEILNTPHGAMLAYRRGDSTQLQLADGDVQADGGRSDMRLPMRVRELTPAIPGEFAIARAGSKLLLAARHDGPSLLLHSINLEGKGQ